MVILNVLFVAAAYWAWLYKCSGTEPAQSFALPGLVALTANICIAWFVFDRDYPKARRCRDSVGIGTVATFLMHCIYMFFMAMITYR
jgi:hypothetical protein